VLEKAMPAMKPSSPQAVKVTGIGLVLGLMAGAGLSLLRDWRDQRVRSQEEITAILGVPILGAIPSITRRAAARGQKLRFASNSRESEACRAIRTTLLYGMRRDQAAAILVTSPGPQEGKTLLVSNLAMALAQAGQRTLIVDADLRKPTKQRVFTMEGHGKGLVDVLAGTATLKEAIRPAETPGLDVLESGQSTSNPSELLSSQAFARLLEQLKGQYDHILIDSPPVGVVTDAQILATVCDSTLLVLRADESSRVLTQRAREALLAVGARVAGVVVNDVSKRNTRYSYYSGYGHYHSHNGSNGRTATRKEVPADAGRRPENAVLTPQTKQCDVEATHVELPEENDPRPESRVLPLEIKEYDGKGTRKKPVADAGPRIDNGAMTSEKKRNGRKATSNGLPGNGDLRPGNEVSAPAKEGNGCKPTGEEPRTDARPRPENGDLAAQNWKKWLGGKT
jgi:capsular exopolysaccharide synthesis family protein